MKQYLDIVSMVLENGTISSDRTGTGTVSVFGGTMKFDLREGFPLLTTKKMPIKTIAAELLWFLSGSTNNNELRDMNCHIWDEWSTADGALGPIYGEQWRAWDVTNETTLINKLLPELKKDYSSVEEMRKALTNTVNENTTGAKLDQISVLINDLKTNPDSRRMVVTAWNPEVLPDSNAYPQDNVLSGKAALPACHTIFQVSTTKLSYYDRVRYLLDKCKTCPSVDVNDKQILDMFDKYDIPTRYIDISVYLRSQDLMLGTPFNIASYALLLEMLGQVTGMIPRNLIWNGGDIHVYLDHKDGAVEQLRRTPKKLPKLQLNPYVNDIFNFRLEDIEIKDYQPDPHIKFDVSV